MFPRCPCARLMEGSEGVQTGSRKHRAGLGGTSSRSSANWLGRLKTLSTWGVWRAPNCLDSADTIASAAAGHSATQTLSQSQPIHQSRLSNSEAMSIIFMFVLTGSDSLQTVSMLGRGAILLPFRFFASRPGLLN